MGAGSSSGPQMITRCGDGSTMPWRCSANSTSGYASGPSSGTTSASSPMAAKRRPSATGGVQPVCAQVSLIADRIASLSGERGTGATGPAL